MSMSVGVLDHYNVSTRNLGGTVRFYEEIWVSSTGHVRRSTSQVRGFTAKATRYCTSMISHPPISRSARISASSTTSPSAVVALKR